MQLPAKKLGVGIFHHLIGYDLGTSRFIGLPKGVMDVVTYDDMLMMCDDAGLTVQEKDLRAHDGLIYNKSIAIRKDIRTKKEKSQVLTEEYAHHKLTVGNILDLSDANARRQERIARDYAFDIKVGLEGLIEGFEKGCRGLDDLSEFLDCTPDYLMACLDRYHQKFGRYKKHGEYLIVFEPAFSILKLMPKGG